MELFRSSSVYTRQAARQPAASAAGCPAGWLEASLLHVMSRIGVVW
jgi:hypothetical protein